MLLFLLGSSISLSMNDMMWMIYICYIYVYIYIYMYMYIWMLKVLTVALENCRKNDSEKCHRETIFDKWLLFLTIFVNLSTIFCL